MCKVGGVPVKFIRERNHSLTYKHSYRRYFHYINCSEKRWHGYNT